MKWQSKEELLQLTKDLVGIKSISATVDEVNAAHFIYQQLQSLDYYKENPDHLYVVDVPGSYERKAIVALMKKGPSKDTLLGVAHFDTVGIDDAGILKDDILNPDIYTQKIGQLNLDPASRADLESGQYLFGRGMMDMKAGVALHMQNLEYYSNDDHFTGNLLIAFVGDEETNSEGVLAGVVKMADLLKEHDLNAIAALDTEPDFASYPNDNNKYMYLGTVGKLLAGFYVYGKETHVGESLAGLNVHLILANIIKDMELNIDFCEQVKNETTLPPTSLKLEDHKDLYNVQTPISGHIYYNLQTFKDSPKVYMDKCLKVADKAINDAYSFVLEQNKKFKDLSNLPLTPLDLKVQTYTYNDFYQEVKAEYSNLDTLLENKILELKPNNLDERDLTLALISYLQEISSNKNPKVVVFFAPPYYPHVSLDESKANHQALLKASNDAIAYAKDCFNEDIKQAYYFQGLCDLSYFALEDAKDVLSYLTPNMPTLDKTYSLPLQAIEQLNVPVINYGPHGRDPHKYTERILVDYSFEVVPVVLKRLIDNLFINLKGE